ncbi:dihydropteroate synthase [Altibacter sp. HG106]|uniref:dihydropteroate synthase n=1 Tax=Altibacter sp. HG106 TaxID=3023937 RepID=UPI0023508AA8|nr:dihydropteroate synthase [Altibacter sp. HG106]MDC7995823.1 dihydropteroate synthase [Altibacter sp. HG106]
MYTLNCRGTLIDLSTPKVMGILNVTPDSFYDGGAHVETRELVAKAALLLEEGATFLDVGGYSSRPGAAALSEAEEIERVVPAIQAILEDFPEALISIDTFRSSVARNALEVGACMVNDISAGVQDHDMLDLVAEFQVPYVMMHMKGTPQTMTQHTTYEHLILEVRKHLSERMAAARKAGINDLIIDPGFGFAKTREQNFELLAGLDLFQEFEVPVLVGVSRKSMIYKTLGITPEEALNGTSVLHSWALQKGCNLLRVHDVKPAVECVQLFEAWTRG